MTTTAPPDLIRVQVADTTLRDGEQSPGAAMTAPEKLRIARVIAGLNVDVLEAGFPVASPGEAEAVRLIASEVEGPVISAMSRCRPADVELTTRAVEPAGPRRRVHLVIAASPIHRTYKLHMEPSQILRAAVGSVRLVVNSGAQAQFAAEDSTRTEPEFLDDLVAAVVEAGATVVCLPDTLGWATPEEYAAMFRRAARLVPANVVLAAHCHNDLGLAVANSLAACQAGARHVECTVNGIGERAGNTALEEFVMSLVTRADYYRLSVGVRTEGLYAACRLLTEVTGLPLARNKPVVGDNVFTTAAGIHQDGLLKNPATYEIFPPEWVGAPRGPLALSKHSGRAAVRSRAELLGLSLTGDQFERLFRAFTQLADTRKVVSDGELGAVAREILED